MKDDIDLRRHMMVDREIEDKGDEMNMAAVAGGKGRTFEQRALK